MPYNKYKSFLTGKVIKPKSTVSRHNFLFNKSTANAKTETPNKIIDGEIENFSLNETKHGSNQTINSVYLSDFNTEASELF